MLNIFKMLFKGETVLVILFFSLLLLSINFYNKSKRLEALSDIMESNYIQQRDKDSLKAIRLQFTTKKALQDYVNKNESLREILNRERIKTKNIKQVITQQSQYIDSLQRSTNVSPLIENIKQNIPGKQLWTDVSKCLTITGDVAFVNDSLTVNVNNRKFNDTTTVVAHTVRRKWSVFGLFNTRIFGRRIIKVTTNNNCGDTKTVIVDNLRNKTR